jgi:ankyrin repeat protein
MISGITPVNNNYYNKYVSFKGNSQVNHSAINFKAEVPQNNPYAGLYEKIRACEISGIEESEIIPPSKESTTGQNPAPVNSEEPEILPANRHGMTELHYICIEGNTAEFDEFVEKHPNFDPNQRDKDGWSYICVATLYNNGSYKEIVNKLAAYKNIDLSKTTSSSGWDDMHLLCYYGCTEAVETFINTHPGFNPNKLTSTGLSYIDIANRNGHRDIVRILRKAQRMKK